MFQWIGLLRSFVVYWRPGRQSALRRLYAPYVRDGDLVFDVGAHLGDRSMAFAALGARVVAFEPQPHVARWLRRITSRQPRIVVRSEAVGAKAGSARIAMSPAHPTVSTLSEAWRTSVTERHEGFKGVRWSASAEVRVVTLDALIEEHGMPSFCKIDVEGFELEVLLGLSRPVQALSFEFVAGQLDTAASCVRRLEQLGRYRYNVVLGESRRFALGAWGEGADMLAWLSSGADGASSGDIYARLEPIGAAHA